MTDEVIEERFGFPDETLAKNFAATLETLGSVCEVLQDPDGTFTVRAYPPGFGNPVPSENIKERESGPVDPLPDPPIGGVQGLLDFIAKFESRGNYNAFFRHANNQTNPQLTSMMLKNVIAFQRRIVKNGAASSASGRYQIIRKTLVGLQSSLALPDSAKFDADLQDRMGVKLLEERGLNAFLAGSKSIESFGNNVAREWAGMPVVTAIRGSQGFTLKPGQSFYAGDGLNKALAGVAGFMRALEAARS